MANSFSGIGWLQKCNPLVLVEGIQKTEAATEQRKGWYITVEFHRVILMQTSRILTEFSDEIPFEGKIHSRITQMA
jgi:hypothetical protein